MNKPNPVIRGWRNYFDIGHSMRQLRALDRYVWFRLWKSAQSFWRKWWPKRGPRG